ncbi:MAG: response regulator transcription factor [Cyclobacteriaceae bacterium]
MKDQIRIMIVDDHEMVIQGLKALIENQPGFRVTSTYNSGLEAIKAYETDKQDIVLMDINMPIINGFETSAEILSKNKDEKIIMLSMEVTRAYMKKALEEGIKGYVSKSADIFELLSAIKSVFQGNKSFSNFISINS